MGRMRRLPKRNADDYIVAAMVFVIFVVAPIALIIGTTL